ncbi:MAG: hypothetical protein PHX08_11315 [Lachnospiraceae bacterium]|nr:hypothetical protein [Lachnospiraceae bacterium]
MIIEVKALDKYEYRVKTEQMLEYMEKKSYDKAMEIADTIDWRRVKNATMLCSVSEIYELNEQYEKSRDVLFIAYDRSPGSRKIVYRLGILALKVGDVNEAMDCYEEFISIAPKDPNQYILRYKILKIQKAPIAQQIEALADFKKAEYVEKWAYELAKLYHEASMTTECLAECDDLILWFSEGKYVYQAMELKMLHKPLTPAQQEKYENRHQVMQPKKNQFIKRERPLENSLAAKMVKAAAVGKTLEELEAGLPAEDVSQETRRFDFNEELLNTKTDMISEEPEAQIEEIQISKTETDEVETDEVETDEAETEGIPEDQLIAGVNMLSGDPTAEINIEEVLATIASEAVAEKAAVDEKVEEIEAAPPIIEEQIPAGPTIEEVDEPLKRQITGQMRIEEILAGWEDKQKEVVKAMEEQKESSVETTIPEAQSQLLEQEQPEELEILEAVEAVEEKPKSLIVSDDIRRLLEELEGDEPMSYEPNEPEYLKKEEVPEEIINKGQTIDNMLVENLDELDDVDEEEDDLEEDLEEDLEDDLEDDLEEDELIAEEPEEELEEMEEDLETADDIETFDELEENVYEEGEDFDDSEIYGSEEESYFDEEDDEYQEYEDIKEETIEEAREEAMEELVVPEEMSFEEDEEFDVEDEEVESEHDELLAELQAERGPSRKEIAKAVATGKTAQLPVGEIASALAKQDTGFIVQGRYDLESQSEIGLRAGLTEEQKKLFSYFVPVRGMSEQLVDVLEQDKQCKNREGTSQTGNLLIIGRKGSGKTVLAVDVVKAIQKGRNIKQGKVAIVTGDSLNRKKVSEIISKLHGGALIIEKASQMNEKTIIRLNKAMERDTGEMLVVLEEQRKPLDLLLAANKEFRRKFTSRLEVPIFINDELVTFGQTYAKENGYKIDEMGILALYSRIDLLQREDHAVAVAEVKEIMDEAIEHSQKTNMKSFVKRVFGKNTDDSDRIILTEKDFNI